MGKAYFRDGTPARYAQPYRLIALACLLLVGVLTFFVCLRSSWAELRWLAPLTAMWLDVMLVAIGCERNMMVMAGAARKQTSRDARPATWNPLKRATWRAIAGWTWGRLRVVRWWPWCVLAGALGSLMLCAATVFVFDRHAAATGTQVRNIMALACGTVLAMAFVTLVIERVIAARVPVQHADTVLAGALRIALVVALACAASAGLYLWRGVDSRWLAMAIALLPALVASEFAVRATLAWFTPPRASASSLALVDSTVVHWLVRPPASPAELGESLRSRFGIDLRQSWVVHSTLRMLPAACVALVAAGWLLSGVTILQPEQRAVYERFGAPRAVWQPGLHMGLPWPFGLARVIDNGAVHQIVVSDIADVANVADRASIAAPLIPADARAPEQLDRLWDVAHPWETSQVIAGANAQQQNFEIVSADVRLDYRIGASEADARAALYRAANIADVTRAIANREIVRYLASHTLDALVEARQTVIADAIRQATQQQLDRLGSGIEVTAVVIESVHPPAGASAAWHGVQAAQIRTAASVAEAHGLAATLVGTAHEQAQASVAEANASAAETLSAAHIQQTTFSADIAAQQAGGPAFAFEYYLRNLQQGLQNANLTVIDDRLVSDKRATIDLRSFNAGDAAGARKLF
ncbi:protease modulator HflK [Paraburkholderia bannensis]|uniref:protease modulator HflK n=1 Tax=Paraburkholderia bannensis TaxID=765414 RepID=UPI002ABE735F|nr:protease modulator HflK [Paraburkholderia bannensis]